MEVTKNTDYTDFNTNPYFIYFFQDGNVKSLIANFDPQHDAVEDVLFDLNSEMWLDTAVGEQLDLLGRHLNLDRSGRDDDAYRSLLKVKVVINVSSGEPEAVIAVAKELYGATIVNYIPDYPAGIILEQNGTLSFFITEFLETAAGETIIFADGEEWEVVTPDLEAEELIFSAVPVGVSVDVQQIP